jgi:hypothetical protein
MDPANALLSLFGALVFLAIAFFVYLWLSTRGTCQYCGRKAGFWRKYHKSCLAQVQEQRRQEEEKRAADRKIALAKWTSACRDYYADRLSEQELESLMDEYSSLLPVSQMQRIADKAQAEAAQQAKREGEAEYAAALEAFAYGQMDEYTFRTALEKATSVLSPQKMCDLESFTAAALSESVLADGILTEDEYGQVVLFLSSVSSGPLIREKKKVRQVFQLRIIQLIRQDRWGDVFGASGLDCDSYPGTVFEKGERPCWEIRNVNLKRERHKKTYVRINTPQKVIIRNGIYVNANSYRGETVDESWMETLAVGTLVLTNKSLRFIADTNSFRIPWKKIVSVSPHRIGASIQKNTKTPVELTGFDPWFLVNFASAIHT